MRVLVACSRHRVGKSTSRVLRVCEKEHVDDVPQFVLTTVADTSDGCTHVCSNARALCKNSVFGRG